MALDYIALGFIFFLMIAATAMIVVLGSIPRKIARKRGHRYADAVNVASWLSFVTLGTLWPLALIWAYFPNEEDSANRTAEPSHKVHSHISGDKS